VGGVITGSSMSVSGAVTGASLTTAGVLTVNSGAAATAIVNGAGNAVGNIGATATRFNTVFALASSAQYADLAEKYTADADYPVGTVLIVGGSEEVTQSTESHSTAIAGTVSENPATVMNSELTSQHVAVVALVGRVPCRVIGNIRKGDLLTSSDTPGVAIAMDTENYRPGCVLGKALQPYDNKQEGIIEILVGRL
jgi:hypothetical protein